MPLPRRSGGPLSIRSNVVSLPVIIVSYNTRELTLRCLRTLFENAATDGVGVRPVVVDNASADGSAAAIRNAFGDAVEVIAAGRNLGFGAANNVALRACEGELALLLNSDAIMRPGALATLLAAIRGRAELGAVGPRLLNADGSLQRSAYPYPGAARAWADAVGLGRLAARSGRFGDFRDWAHDGRCDVPMLSGACLLVRLETVRQVGLFDESFFLYAEETDLCRRLTRAGWKIGFVPEAEVVHLGGASGSDGGGGQSAAVFCEFERGQERFVRKHQGAAGLLAYRAARVASSSLRAVAYTAMSCRPGSPASRRRWSGPAATWRRVFAFSVGVRAKPLRSDAGADVPINIARAEAR